MKYRQKKYKVGELYTIKRYSYFNNDRLISIFIEEKYNGDNVFYCPEINQYIIVDYKNHWIMKIEKYE